MKGKGAVKNDCVFSFVLFVNMAVSVARSGRDAHSLYVNKASRLTVRLEAFLFSIGNHLG